MKKILVTGGPVHAYLDSVKIITNRFKGGLIADLVNKLLAKDVSISYVYPASLDIKKPNLHENLILRGHNGFDDYKRIVLELAPQMDAVILGGAVANLIPLYPFKGKFPSHQYKPGDIIPIDFTIAPRVIDEVKKIAPRTHVFGFKLLSDVTHDELIRAAYEIVLDSGATAVFANDTADLKQKYAVTKERGVHPLTQDNLAGWIWEMIDDTYYQTLLFGNRFIPSESRFRLEGIIERYQGHFTTVENGMIFGTVAVRYGNGFLTTGRGKRELNDIVHIVDVDHDKRQVIVAGPRKASLNAPLLARIFENPEVDYVVHYHEQEAGLPIFSYAPPGTIRDTNRPNNTSFNIKEHGCMLMFDKKWRRL